jgi:hypothetical protein
MFGWTSWNGSMSSSSDTDVLGGLLFILSSFVLLDFVSVERHLCWQRAQVSYQENLSIGRREEAGAFISSASTPGRINTTSLILSKTENNKLRHKIK